tara:strand:- start:2968 stop:4038 length:1071 start_codon:yes stop_codon:yes gene_type:complete
MKIKLISVVGNRPQFIKLKPLSDNIKKFNKLIHHKIIHTGQHYDKNMSDIFFNDLKLPKPHFYLNVGGISDAEFLAKVISKLETILLKEKPNGVIVYGDTNTTLAAAICSSKLKINIFHVEAGLRCYDKNMPEEINRLLTDHLSDLHFVPTKFSKTNLLKENINKNKIKFVGDIMYELLINTIKSNKFNKINEIYNKNKEYILFTVHRAENTLLKNKMKQLLSSIKKIDFQFIWPCHPRTKKFLKDNKINIPKNINIIEPIGYFEMISLIKNSLLVITDSGGVQKESFFLKKISIILRNHTEWKEILEKNNSILLKEQKLEKVIKKMINKKFKQNKNLNFKTVSTNIIKEIINFYE